MFIKFLNFAKKIKLFNFAIHCFILCLLCTIFNVSNVIYFYLMLVLGSAYIDCFCIINKYEKKEVESEKKND